MDASFSSRWPGLTRQRLAPTLLVSLLGILIATVPVSGQGPYTLLHSLFDPGTNAQTGAEQGYSVALDGNIVVTGSPFVDDVAVNSGVVKVYTATTGALLHRLTNPSPGTSDHFGYSVAISGTRVVVGAYMDDTGATDAGSAYVYDLASATPTVPVATLNNPFPRVDGYFGFSVAVSGTRVAVGSPYSAPAGRAYVYDMASAAPTLPVATLHNPGLGGGDIFGNSIAVSGTRVVVGAPFGSIGGTYAGNAYIYDMASATPAVPVATLTNPSPAVGDRFGCSVAVSGTRVVVGAYQDGTGANGAGSAYVYDVANATPTVPVATLNNPIRRADDQFGYSVAVSDTRVVVGAFQADTGATNAGRVYVYDLPSSTPPLPAVTLALNNPSPALDDQFGYSVAVSHTRVVVGANRDDFGAENAGSAYMYDVASTTPTVPVATLNNPSLMSFDYFGRSVAMSGTRVVVGAYGDWSGAPGTGSAYVYELSSTTPTAPVVTLNNPSPVIDDQFGYSVAVSGTRVVVGVVHYDADANVDNNAGRAYLYDLAGATPTVPVATLTNPSPAAGDWFGFSVGISGTHAVVCAPFDDTGATDAGSIYVYELASATPTVPIVTLTNPSPAAFHNFGSSLAVFGTREMTPALPTGAASTCMIWPAPHPRYVSPRSTIPARRLMTNLDTPWPSPARAWSSGRCLTAPVLLTQAALTFMSLPAPRLRALRSRSRSPAQQRVMVSASV